VRNPITAVPASIVAATCFLAIACSPAAAFTGHPPVSQFGTFTHPTGVAVDDASGEVLVADGAPSEAVDIFGADRTTISALGGFVFGFEPVGVAVDNSGGPADGDLYVTDVRVGTVEKFTRGSSGDYELASELTGLGESSGVAVDSAGDLYVADYEIPGGPPAVQEFDPAGIEIARFTPPLIAHPQGVAVDAAGDIFVQGYGTHNLVELTRSSDTSAVVLTETQLFEEGVTAIALDRGAGRLYVDLGVEIEELGPAAEELSRFGAGELTESLGVAIDETTGKIYASDNGQGDAQVFGPFAASLPDVTTEFASGTSSTAATLNGILDPLGEAANYWFEYGTTRAYGSDAPLPPGTPVPAENTDLPAATTLSGLQPATEYHFRLAAENAEGTNRGADQTFRTEAAEPLIDRLPSAAHLDHRSARLSGSVDPENSPTTYHFEYGLTANYGARTPEAPVGAGLADVAVGPQLLTGLEPGAVYHYRLVASNIAGVTRGTDQTFTTGSPVSPQAATGAATEITQTTATISGSVDPAGLPTSYRFEYGTDASYGSQVFGDAGQATGPVGETLDLSGLAPGTTYHYRLVAQGEDATAFGEDHTFTTPGVAYPLLAPSARPLQATSPAKKHHKKHRRKKHHKRRHADSHRRNGR
jgi:DNA-binding beta-propeller fold protein YncE